MLTIIIIIIAHVQFCHIHTHITYTCARPLSQCKFARQVGSYIASYVGILTYVMQALVAFCQHRTFVANQQVAVLV